MVWQFVPHFIKSTVFKKELFEKKDNYWQPKFEIF
jgi:hypothetical protein